MMRLKNKHWDWWLIGILLLATFLYAWNIWEAGSANAYYTAAVTSMTQSWHNFWYGAFDPAGFITVDKPPIALWFMAISAKLFGVHGWSVVLPSILFGIGSVYLLYVMIKPRFGEWAARLAALALTLTPIAVADTRTNNMDTTLVFFLLLASYLLMRAVAQKRSWLVLLAFALIGVAFNIKMLQAFMILPAMYLFYWFASSAKWPRKMATLALATAAGAVFTLAWPVAVDTTNASSRPYIGSSQSNSVLELAFGYNGTERLLGQSTGMGGAFGGMGGNNQATTQNGTGNTGTPPTTAGNNNATGGTAGQNGQSPNTAQVPGGTPPNGLAGANNNNGGNSTGTPPTGTQGGPGGQNGTGTGNTGQAQGGQVPGRPGQGGQGRQGGPGGGGGGGGAFAIGTAGPLRLFQSDLGPQISWLLPAALIGSISGLAYFFDRNRKWYQLGSEQKQILFWLAWLIPVAGFFSIASFFHPYYTIMLAPPIAALFGIGMVTMARQFKGTLSRWTTWLLPISVGATTALQAWYVATYYSWQPFLLLAAGIAAIAVLFISRVRQLKQAGIAITLATLLAAPAWWALTPTLAGASSAIPSAGPALLTRGGANMGALGDSNANAGMLTYLLKNQGDATYLFATADASTAAPYIIESGKAVMAVGGFNGTDPSLTLKQFKALVKAGKVKYYYAGGKSGNSDIEKWVTSVGKKINASEYGGTDTSTTTQTNAQANATPGGQNAGTGKTAGNANTATQANRPGGGPGGMGSNGTLYQLTADMVD